MSWKKLEKLEQLDEIIAQSKENPVVIFKHSTRCSISSMAWNRIERSWKEEDSLRITPYYLDLLAYRDISDAIAHRFAVPHASPQVILIKNGEAAYDTSHMGISYSQLIAQADN